MSNLYLYMKGVRSSLIKGIDGFYYFNLSTAHGLITSNGLRSIADKLDELNRLLEEQIKKDESIRSETIEEIDL